MNFVYFTHSLVSDWNHGNAHFLRGVATELVERGHQVKLYEPTDSWSRSNLLRDHGEKAVTAFQQAYPRLGSEFYGEDLDLTVVLREADVAIVHEWNAPDLVRRIGEHHAAHPSYQLLFHDTHHRAVTAERDMAAFDLSHYDAVLAYGATLRDVYRAAGWSRAVHVWHEAADVRVFRPLNGVPKQGDVVWIGNWGDDERTAELGEYLFEPVRELGLKAEVYGVRYPKSALRNLKTAGIRYGGWVANHEVPRLFARFRATVHVPRRPYVKSLPGIPTIRPFEAMACGIPLISAPWTDSEKLFQSGSDYLMAESGTKMKALMAELLRDETAARQLAEHGRKTILARHTCAHRVDELLDICASSSA